MEQIDKVELASTSHIVRNNDPERTLISINKVPLHIHTLQHEPT